MTTAREDDNLAVRAMREMAAHSRPDEMAEAVTRDIAAEVWPERCRDTEFRNALGLSVRDNVRALIATIAGAVDLHDANPEGAFAFADLTAELGIPVSELESAYWVGSRAVWREWYAHVRSVGGHGEAAQVELVGRATMLIFDYVIQTISAVVARYDVTRAEILRNREDRRRAVLGQILDGSIGQITGEVENLLGYRLRSMHLALALEIEERPQAERVAALLAEAAEADDSMMLLHAPGTWILWLAFVVPVGADRLALLAKAARTAGLVTSIGAPGLGLDGLRRTCEQALGVKRVRDVTAGGLPPVVLFADIRLEMLMLHDEEAARVFVRDELGELATYDERSNRTCEALLAWLATGSQLDAAGRLGVHKNTMRLRIAHAGELLGHRLDERRAEVLVALRLREVFRPRT